MAGRDQWIMFFAKKLPVIEDYPLAVRFTILRDADTQRRIEVDPDAKLIKTDKLRICLESNSKGYLYILVQGGPCGWRMWIPGRNSDTNEHFITRPRSPQITDLAWLDSDQDPSTTQMVFILSRSPVVPLEAVLASRGMNSPREYQVGNSLANPKVSDSIVSSLRRDVKIWNLLSEKLDNAVYIANRKPDRELRIVADISLSYQ